MSLYCTAGVQWMLSQWDSETMVQWWSDTRIHQENCYQCCVTARKYLTLTHDTADDDHDDDNVGEDELWSGPGQYLWEEYHWHHQDKLAPPRWYHSAGWAALAWSRVILSIIINGDVTGAGHTRRMIGSVKIEKQMRGRHWASSGRVSEFIWD